MLVSVVVLGCILWLYMFVWNPILEEVERLQTEIQIQEREIQAHLQKIATRQMVEQQLYQVRNDLEARIKSIPAEVNPSTFRKEMMMLAKESGVGLRIWKPEGSFFGMEKTPQTVAIALTVEGGFHSAVRFLSGLAQIPWVGSITSVSIEGKEKSNGQFSTVMEIKIRGLTGVGIEQVKELLAA